MLLEEHEEQRHNAIVDSGAELVGGMVEASVAEATATAIGLAAAAISGPVSAAIGAVVGYSLGKAAEEAYKRAFTKKQKERVVTLLSLSKAKIEDNLKSGKEIRNDGFFEKDIDDRSPADELLEGTFDAAQREYEERKTQLLANLNANIAFDKEVSRSMANQLLRIASDLSYRQILILQLIGLYQTHPELDELRLMRRRDSLSGHITGIDNVSVATDIFELYRRSLLHSPSVMLDIAGIEPAKLILAGCGAKLYTLMELDALNYDTEEHMVIFAFLTGGKAMS